MKVYLLAEGRPATVTTSKFNANAISKKELSANDDTGAMKITLWEDNIKQVPVNGTYQITNVTVREYPKGVLSLSAGTRANIIEIDDTIKPRAT